MLKIGIIGLGDIAQKAYLPLLGQLKIELHLYTRDQAKMRDIGEHYRIKYMHRDIDSLIKSGIQAAFVHTSTASHHSIIEQLLENNIHVYVDKPITYEFVSSDKLINLAKQKNLILKVGFNRRYAPAYSDLKSLKNPNMIIMQKNRKSLPGDVRTFIFDDFIHVVDTLLYLFPYAIESMTVAGRRNDNLLFHVTIQITSPEGFTAIGIMNRDSGTTEEKLEIFTSDEKRMVINLEETIIDQNKNQTRTRANDWEPTLHKRGFHKIIDTFLQNVESNTIEHQDKEDALLTHKICEEIVEKLQN